MNTRYILAAIVMTAMLAAARPVAADQVIFLVRHAERAATAAGAAPSHGGMPADDPPLSPAGEQRADKLASMLAASNIKFIYTSEFKRTRQTAAPLAKKLSLTAVMAAANDPTTLVATLKGLQGNALVVGHSNTVPDLLKRLGVAETVTIGDSDYDNLFVVVRDAAGKATLVRLKF